MSKNNRDKYRSESTRLKSWDYGWNASYFVTICTKGKVYSFGNIVAEEILLSDVGKIAKECWIEIPFHFPFVHLGEFIVMPNHVHGIINIRKSSVETQNFASQNYDSNRVKERENIPSRRRQRSLNVFGPQSRNLGSVVRGFKIGVTKQARSIDQEFSWQPRYHDHIIRDEESYQRISEYIQWNPRNWKTDKYR